jgi:outer membrane protein assembly factor BamB
VTPSLVIVGTGAGQTYALARKTGEVVWRFRIPGRAGCCVADGKRVFVGGWDGNVYVRSLSDGSPLWVLKTDADVRGFPTLHGGWLFIGSLDFSIYAVKYL